MSIAAVTLALGLWPTHSVAVYVAGAVFGGSYIALTGVLIIWASQVAPGQEAAGTAALFITLAAGRAVGAFLFGVLLELSNPTPVFVLAAALASCSAVPAMLNTSADTVRELAAGRQGR